MTNSTPVLSKPVRESHLCPNCNQGRDRVKEIDDGYQLCGLCKGKGWVECVNEIYSTVRYNFFGRRSGMDVVRVRAVESKENVKEEEETARKIGSKFLGYYPYYKTLVQNDIN